MSQKIKTSVEIDGSLSASQIANATTDTDKFLVSDNGTVKYRTGAEMLSDLGVSQGIASRIQHQVKAGVAINKGQAVYVTSADGTNMIVGLASNASESTSSKTMGLLNATVSTNGFADVITEGLLSGLDTSTAVVGNPVWLGTGGNLIYGLANKPYAPEHLVFIGIVTRVNANNGEIFVKVQNGFELEELHNVDLQTTTPINGHLLGYNGTLWVNKTIAGWLGYTPQAQLNGTGFVKASGTTITYDNTSYYPASNPNGYISTYTETDTLASVTARGALTNTPISISAGTLNHLTLAERFNLVGGSNFHITNNAYYDSGFKYKFADLAGKLALQADGILSYQTAAVGTIGAAITFDTKFSVDSSGNLTVPGTLSASGYNKTNWDTAYGWGNHAFAGYVPQARTITINGTSYDLSDNRSWTVTASENDTLATVVARGNTANSSIAVRNSISINKSDGSSGGQLSYDSSINQLYLWNSLSSGYFSVYTNNAERLNISSGGAVTANVDMRAPIFYDSNNTAYYLDPASTSNLNGLTVANTITGSVSGSSGSVGGISASQIVYGSGSSKVSSHANANEWRNSGFYENEGGGSNWPSGIWYNSINVRHSNQGNYHGFQLAMSYYDNNLWFRSYQGAGTFQGWQRAAVARGEGTNYIDYSRYVYNNGAYSGSGWIEPSDLGVRYANSAGSATNATNSDNAGNLRTAYAGGQQLNPQVYFNNGIGLKAAMTAKVGVWSDTLWINGYSGGDVLWMCALHTQRNSAPRMYISAQQSTSSSYGTAYEFLTEYNYSDYTVTKTTNQDITGIKYFVSNRNTSSDSPPLQAYSNNGGGAIMSFHRGGYYAVNFGLDSDNVIRIGGWSAGANRWQLDMSGNMTVAGDVTAYSDVRVKENIETIDKALDKVLSLRGVTYNRIDSEDKSEKIGVIAQEVQNILPQVVHEQADGMLGVSYGNITAVLIEAIKEQQTQIEELKQLVNKLTNK